MACDTKLRLEGIPEKVQRAFFVTRNEDVTFTRLEDGPHHDGVRFGNGAEVTLQQLGTGVQGWVFDALSSPLTVRSASVSNDGLSLSDFHCFSGSDWVSKQTSHPRFAYPGVSEGGPLR